MANRTLRTKTKTDANLDLTVEVSAPTALAVDGTINANSVDGTAQAEPATPAKSPAELVAQALATKRAATADALLTNYVLNNDPPKDRNLATVMRVFETTVELGHVEWPRSLQSLVRDRDVLDFRCGATLHGVAFRALGARSYTGVDKSLDPTSRRLRNRILKKTEKMAVSQSDAARVIPGLSYMRADDIMSEGIYDVILLRSVTQSLPDLEGTIARLARALRSNGEIWFLHENFYAWGGHQGAPKNPKAIDPDNPDQVAMADWGHVLFAAPADHRLSAFNRVRLPELRQLFNRHFGMHKWQAIPERQSVIDRLTPQRHKALIAYQSDELLTRQVIGIGRKRD